MRDNSITIIGAGPAGLITGLKLIEAGFSPVILEKGRKIVSTLCGEGISGRTLSMIPFRDWSEYAASTLDHATFVFPGGTRSYVKVKCHTMDRTAWQRAMAREFERRGGRIELGVAVADVKKIKSGLVIGADGPYSVAGKFVGNRVKFMAGVQARIKSGYDCDGMEFHLSKKYSEEYAWIFPRGDMLNVGLLGDFSRLEMFLSDVKLESARVLERRGYVIPFFGKTVQRENVILTGDAAGITNPLTKGGMAAIVHAADVIVRCLKENKIGEYQKRLFSHPVVSPVFMEALTIFRNLSDKDLEKMGKMLAGQDMNNLGRLMRIKFLLAALSNPAKTHMITKACSYVKDYSW